VIDTEPETCDGESSIEEGNYDAADGDKFSDREDDYAAYDDGSSDGEDDADEAGLDDEPMDGNSEVLKTRLNFAGFPDLKSRKHMLD
jgi:hypothetical protein